VCTLAREYLRRLGRFPILMLLLQMGQLHGRARQASIARAAEAGRACWASWARTRTCPPPRTSTRACVSRRCRRLAEPWDHLPRHQQQQQQQRLQLDHHHHHHHQQQQQRRRRRRPTRTLASTRSERSRTRRSGKGGRSGDRSSRIGSRTRARLRRLGAPRLRACRAAGEQSRAIRHAHAEMLMRPLVNSAGLVSLLTRSATRRRSRCSALRSGVARSPSRHSCLHWQASPCGRWRVRTERSRARYCALSRRTGSRSWGSRTHSSSRGSETPRGLMAASSRLSAQEDLQLQPGPLLHPPAARGARGATHRLQTHEPGGLALSRVPEIISGHQQLPPLPPRLSRQLRMRAKCVA